MTWAALVHVVISGDRKSTRLNSSHVEISYAAFCLKKKKNPRGQGVPRLERDLVDVNLRWHHRVELRQLVLAQPGGHPPRREQAMRLVVFFIMMRRLLRSTLFPYTTLFR